MRKFLFSCCFVLVGVGLWIALSNTAKFSIKKWDAKFATVLRFNLHSLGLSDKDLLASFNKVQKDKDGEWITHNIKLHAVDQKMKNKLKSKLQSSGADVVETVQNGETVLLVKRGSRVYQEIHILPPIN